MTAAHQDDIHRMVSQYYSDKFSSYGATPAGVDWRDVKGQELRFRKLLDILKRSDLGGSLAELGCGYGALASYMRSAGIAIAYTGYDIVPAMIAAAEELNGHLPDVTFRKGSKPAETVDYCVASGIFNVRQHVSDEVWRQYVDDTLDTMAQSSRRGFAANFLTRWSDADRMVRRLYYADPGEMLNRCISRYGKHVSVMHGYSLYEFTVLVWHGEGEE